MWGLEVDKNTGDRLIVNRLSGKTVAVLTPDTSEEDAHILAAASTSYQACLRLHHKEGINNENFLERAVAKAEGQHLLAKMLEP